MANSQAANNVRIILIGSNGRMGQSILNVVESEFSDRAQVIGTIDRNSGDQLTKLSADVILDVSVPIASEHYLQELLKSKSNTPYVIGCTGWNDQQLKAVHDYAERTSVVMAPNFSPGVNLFLSMIEQAAPLLKSWGYDVSIHETHHTKKLDSPSGTAKAIVERLGKLKAQVHASRAGNIVGTHEVRFVGASDILTMTHEALDRIIFARGAVMAAIWTANQKSPGLYSMKDVIIMESL